MELTNLDERKTMEKLVKNDVDFEEMENLMHSAFDFDDEDELNVSVF